MLDLAGLQPQVRYIGVNLGDSSNFPPTSAKVSFVSEIKVNTSVASQGADFIMFFCWFHYSIAKH